jgi:hypothetical protein
MVIKEEGYLKMVCSECIAGFMIYQNDVITTMFKNVAFYKHICDTCNREDYFICKYPEEEIRIVNGS